MTNRWITPIVLALMATFVLGASSATRAGEFLFIDDFEDTATLTGRVLDTNAFVDQGVELPVEGVEVTLLGVPGSAISGANGEFILRGVPAGEQVLDLDTGPATPAPTGDPYAGFRERIVLRGFNRVLRPFYLPRIDSTSLTTIDPTQTTLVTNPNLDIEMTVVANSAMAEDGSLFDGQLSISEVPNALAPAALPDFLEPGLLVTIQPVGVTFDPPAPITFPNFDNLPPGSGTDLWSLDPESGQFVVVGTGEVSADGQRVETISGGIVAADWHAPPPPPPEEGDGDDDGPPSCNGCCPSCAGAVGSSVDLFNGAFSETLRLPGVISMNREFAPEFVYSSRRAFPFAVIPVNSAIVGRAATPNQISYRGFIDGELAQDEVFVDTSTLTPRGPIVIPTEEPFRVAAPFDNSARATGIHDANVMVTSIYDRSRISSENEKPLTVVNDINSPFGAGWSLAGLDRLVLDAPGTIRERLLLVEGDGGSVQFEEQLSGVNPDGVISIVIPQNTSAFWPTETNAMIAILDDMGLPSQLVVGTDFTQEVVDQSRMVIFMDFTFRHNADSPVIQQIADVMKIAQDNGVPTYYVGQEPAFLNNAGAEPEFMDLWLGLWNLQIASSTSGGEGVVTVTDPTHPVFDGPAGSLIQFNVSGDVDVTRGSNTGEVTIAESATADIVLVEESAVGGRNVTMNTTIAVNQPTADRDELALVVRNTVTWLLQSPSLTSGFFGEGEFAAVAGDYSGIVRDPGTGTFTRVMRDGSVHLFDADGRMTSAVDRNGNAITYAYDAQDRLQSITDPVGRVTTFAYDGNGRLDAITDPAGRVTDFNVDAAGNLTGVTFPDGATRGFGYDARHLMTAQTSPRGFVTQYQYDGLGFFAQSTQPDGSLRQVNPAQKIGLVDTSGGLGSEGNPAPIVRPETALSGFVDPEGRVLTAATGRFGEPVAVAEPSGIMRTIDRDANGNPVLEDAPGSNRISRVFNAFGNPVLVTDQTLGGSTQFTFDTALNRPLSIVDPAGETSSAAWDANGNLVGLTWPSGLSLTQTFNADGLLASRTSINGLVTTFEYDALGNRTALTSGTGPEQRRTEVARDARGQAQAITDAEGNTLGFEIDSMDRLTALVLPDARRVEFTYDDDGQRASLTPPAGNAYGFTYSNTGRPSAEQYPAVAGGGSNEVSYGYDASGRLTSVNRADGSTLGYARDSAGRIVAINMPQGNYTFAYDPASGLQTSAGSPQGVTQQFEYLGGLLTAVDWLGPVTGRVEYEYDASGRLGALTVAGTRYDHAYDANDNLTQVGAFTLAYDPATGEPIATSLDAIDEAMTFNAFGELASHSVSDGVATLYDVSYSRDRLGRITMQTETIQGVTRSLEYDYDPAGRLVTVRENGVVAFSYGYDPNNNRSDGGPTLDAQDRLLSWMGVNHGYSADGERTSSTDGALVTQYRYDAQGSLTGATLADGRVIEYLLDGQGRRVAKRVDGVLENGWLYTNALKPIARLDAAGQVDQRYVYATTSQAPVYIETDSGDRYRIISDHLGSVRLVIDSLTGAIVQRIDYDPWGRITMDTNPGFQPFAYTGGLYDLDTGLQNFGQREYDPRTARWMTRDPIGFDGGQFNLYEYSGSDPVNRTDRTGLESDDPTVTGTTVNVVSGLHTPSGVSEVAGATGALVEIAASGIAGQAFQRTLVDATNSLGKTPAGRMASQMLNRFGDEVGSSGNVAEVLQFIQRGGNQEKLNAIQRKLNQLPNPGDPSCK